VTHHQSSKPAHAALHAPAPATRASTLTRSAPRAAPQPHRPIDAGVSRRPRARSMLVAAPCGPPPAGDSCLWKAQRGRTVAARSERVRPGPPPALNASARGYQAEHGPAGLEATRAPTASRTKGGGLDTPVPPTGLPAASSANGPTVRRGRRPSPHAARTARLAALDFGSPARPGAISPFTRWPPPAASAGRRWPLPAATPPRIGGETGTARGSRGGGGVVGSPPPRAPQPRSPWATRRTPRVVRRR